MANLQQLSPAGYLINNDPMNKNPFFSFEGGEVDPSIDGRLLNLEQTVSSIQSTITEMEIDIEDLETYAGQLDLEIENIKNMSFTNANNITAINNDITEITNNITDLQDDVNHILTVDIVDIENDVNINTQNIETNTQAINNINLELFGVLSRLEAL